MQTPGLTGREKALEIRKNLNAAANAGGEAQEIDKPIVKEAVAPVAPAKPDAPIDYKSLYESALQTADKTEKNYNELRSHSDRVANENKRLESENETLAGNVIPDNLDKTEKPPESVEDITDQRAGESDNAYVERLETAISEYPDVAGPIVDAMNRKYKDLNSRFDALEGTVNNMVDKNAEALANETEDKNKVERDNYMAEISAAHPNFMANFINNQKFSDFLTNHGLSRLYIQTIFPGENEEGGTAKEVIGIFNEFTRQNPESVKDRADPVPDIDAERLNAAAEDSIDKMPVSPLPELNDGTETITRSQLDAWAKNPKLWKENKERIKAAQAAGLF